MSSTTAKPAATAVNPACCGAPAPVVAPDGTGLLLAGGGKAAPGGGEVGSCRADGGWVVMFRGKKPCEGGASGGGD